MKSSCMLIPNSRIFQAMIIGGKWCVKVEERLVKNWPVSLLLVLRTQR